MPDEDQTDKFDPRFDPRYQPGYTQGPNVPALPDQLAQHSKSNILSPDVDDDVQEQDEEIQSVEPNTFERTLLVVAAVLVIGGVAASYWANSINYAHSALGSPWTWRDLLQSAAWTLSAPMVTVGLAIGVGLLFRRAIAWKRRE